MIVAIAGLPGSGKSRLVREYEARGFAVIDDINANSKGGWIGNITLARSLIAGGRDVAITDIMFCEDGWRARLETDLGAAIHWICFENNPAVCERNCRYRARLNPRQIIEFELAMIERLSSAYSPVGEVIAIVDAERERERELGGART